MEDTKKVLPEDITDVNMFAAVLNKQFAKYNELFTKTMTKEQIDLKHAELIVENKTIMDNLKLESDKVTELKKKFTDMDESLRIQGETITKLKTAFVPDNQSKTFASRVSDMVKTSEFMDWAMGKRSSARFELETKDTAFTGTYGSGAAGQPFMPFQVPQLPPQEAVDVRLILPTGTINNSSLEYPMEYSTGYTNNMDWAAENAAATETAIAFTMGTAYATRITTFINVSRSALQNSVWLNQYISNRLMQALVGSLNAQAIAGAGSGAGMAGDNALKGLYTFANTFAGTNFSGKIDNANFFDVLNCAKGEMNALYHIVANSYLINPYDGTILTSSKNTISDFVAPATFLQPNATGYTSAFGMRQIESGDITVDKYMVAAIAPQFMQLLFNGPIEVLATDAHDTNFLKDIVTIKLESKVLLPVYNANAIMKGTLSTDKNTILGGA